MSVPRRVVGVRRRLSGFRRRLATALADVGVPGFEPRGIYVPYAQAASRRAASASAPEKRCATLTDAEPLPWLLERLAASMPAQRAVLERAALHAPVFASRARLNPREPNGARLDQDWFPGLDAVLAYTMVIAAAPPRIVEVGSGHSTRWLAQAIVDGGLATTLTSVDPQPRRDIDSLCESVIRSPLEQVDDAVFGQLRSGDILFIDSSHVALPGTDVERLLLGVLPNLAPGILVHIHDVFLPFGYPAPWARREYNEQHLVAMLLAGGERFRIVAANHYLRRCHAALLTPLGVDIAPGRYESSLWLQTAD